MKKFEKALLSIGPLGFDLEKFENTQAFSKLYSCAVAHVVLFTLALVSVFVPEGTIAQDVISVLIKICTWFVILSIVASLYRLAAHAYLYIRYILLSLHEKVKEDEEDSTSKTQ